MKILNITVLKGLGALVISLETDLPNGIWPYEGHQNLKMELANDDHHEEYLQNNFPGIPVRTIKV